MRSAALIALMLSLAGCNPAGVPYRVRPDGEGWKAQPKDFNVKINCEAGGNVVTVDVLLQNFGKPFSFDIQKLVSVEGGEKNRIEYRMLKAEGVRLDEAMTVSEKSERVYVEPLAIFEGQYEFIMSKTDPEQIKVQVQSLDPINKVFPAVCSREAKTD